MNAVVRALPRTACLSGLFGPAKRTPLRAAPFERITARSNDPARWRALQWATKWT
jgi:hypothetical protein